jgi:uncharacterized protein (DUF362 family)
VPKSAQAAVCTHPELARAVADAVIALGARPVIAEASAPGNDTEQAYAVMGYDALREEGYELVDLNVTPTLRLPVPGGGFLSEVTTFEWVARADAVITLPVLKTHCQAYVTLSLKNQMGLAAGEQKIAFHRQGLYDSICDINAVVRPRFALVDGILAQEGLGPVNGFPVEMNLLVAGRDLLAVDATCARIMGFQPTEVPLLARAAERGLGTLDAGRIDVVGEPLETVRRRFMRAEEDPRAPLDGVTLLTDEACLGCQNSLYAALLQMELDGTRARADGLTFATGQAALPDDLSPDELIAVGRCCPAWTHELAGFVPGCPPRSQDIFRTVLARD